MLTMQNSKLISSVTIIFESNQDCLISQNVACFDAASFSGFQTMASYLCVHYPHLTPPGCQALQQNCIDNAQFPSPYLTLNKYLQPWCDYFNSLLDQKHLNGVITQKDRILYLICKVNEAYFKNLISIVNKQKFKSYKYSDVSKLLDETKFITPIQNRIKVGVINFATSQLKNQPFAPKVNLLSLFTGIWFQHSDSWRKYDVLKQDYPTQQQILKKDIFILSGSSHSVNDRLPQVDKVMKLLMNGLKKNKKLKLLGICFGHQAIAHYFGGKVIKKQIKSGIEIVSFRKEQLDKFSHFQLLKESHKQGYLVSQFHSDYVVEIPKGFITLASSKSCQNESIMSEDGRVLTFQFHSQYTTGYAYAFEIMLNKYYNKNYEVKSAKSQQSVDKSGVQRHHESSKIIRDVVRKFIQWKIQ